MLDQCEQGDNGEGVGWGLGESGDGIIGGIVEGICVMGMLSGLMGMMLGG